MAIFPIKLIKDDTNIDFLGRKFIAFIMSSILICLTIFFLFTRGLNFGIDFTGGILIDARLEQNFELSDMREKLKTLDVGDIALQNFGEKNEILIRVGQSESSESDRVATINKIKQSLGSNFGSNIEYRKVDYVGPKVGAELIQSGALSLILAFAAIMCYIWLRFEWQYGLGAIIALIHDSILTLGFFSFTQLEFNLSSVAAILTIIGYSINDSVVIFDRIRENIRKFKKMPLSELLNLSINENLTRTLITSLTTIIALVALVMFGGEIIMSFSQAALFGVVVGTYSSIYVAAPILIYFNLRRENNQA